MSNLFLINMVKQSFDNSSWINPCERILNTFEFPQQIEQHCNTVNTVYPCPWPMAETIWNWRLGWMMSQVEKRQTVGPCCACKQVLLDRPSPPDKISIFNQDRFFYSCFAHTKMFWKFGMPFTDTTTVKNLSGLTSHKLSPEHVLEL